MTTKQILLELKHAGKRIGLTRLYHYFNALKIKTGTRQRPQQYPPDTAARLLKHLGVSGRVRATRARRRRIPKFSMGKIASLSIVDLEVFYRIGVPDEERAKPQRLLLTVEMERDFSAAAQSDSIADTINYFAVSQRLLGFGEGRTWKLIEKLAADICEMILAEFKPQSVTVEIKKFPIQQARHVSVTLARNRN